MTHLQKFRLPALIFAVCLSLALVRGSNAYAADLSLDSSIISSGNAIDQSFGVENYPDSLGIYAIRGDSPVTLISTSTPYTILSISLFSATIDSNVYLKCGGEDVTNGYVGTISADQMENASPVPAYFTYNQSSQVHCSGDLVFSDIDDGAVQIQYVPYDTRNMIESTSTMPVTDTHFGIIAGYWLAFATMIFIVWLFKGKKRI